MNQKMWGEEKAQAASLPKCPYSSTCVIAASSPLLLGDWFIPDDPLHGGVPGS